MSELSPLLWIISLFLTVSGLVGLLLPILPGAPLIFLGLLCGAWAENFQYIGIWSLLVLLVMTMLTYVVEFTASILGVNKYGGSRRAMAGAAIGGVCGLFFGVVGILFGPFIGAVIGELSLHRNLDQASRAGLGTVVGLALGIAGKLAIGIAMVGLFLVVRFL